MEALALPFLEDVDPRPFWTATLAATAIVAASICIRARSRQRF